MSFIRTPEQFTQTVVVDRTTETHHLEFKSDLDKWRAPDAGVRRLGQKEFCRDVSQFANSSGGCLVIGVETKRVGDAVVVSAIPGVDDFDGRREWMEQAIHNFLAPAAFGVMIDRIVRDQVSIVAVNVPPSERLVKLWDYQQGTIECFRRTNHGKQAMHPDEMEIEQMNSRRAAKLAFDRVRSELANTPNVDLLSGVWSGIRRASGDPTSVERIPVLQVSLGEVREHEFELRVQIKDPPPSSFSIPTIRIPYGLLREVWVTADRRIGLFLHVRVLYQRAGDMLALDPF